MDRKLEEIVRKHAIVTALEAATVARHIISDSAHTKTVIANVRYGWDWVINPVKHQLQEHGIKVVRVYANSGYYWAHRDHYYPAAVPRSVDPLKSKVFVVDGTVKPSKTLYVTKEGEAGELVTVSRFPDATLGYILAFEGHPISFWARDITENVLVKGVPTASQNPGARVEFVNATAMTGSKAIFDDPELYLKKIKQPDASLDKVLKYAKATIQATLASF